MCPFTPRVGKTKSLEERTDHLPFFMEDPSFSYVAEYEKKLTAFEMALIILEPIGSVGNFSETHKAEELCPPKTFKILPCK
jgi:hypothetical protein